MFPRVGEHPRLGFFQALRPPLSCAETFPLVSSPPPPPSRYMERATSLPPRLRFRFLTVFYHQSNFFYQVSASVAIASLVYMRFFLLDSIIDEQLTAPILTSKGKPKGKGKDYATNEIPSKNVKIFKSAPSLEDMLCLLKSRLVVPSLRVEILSTDTSIL